MTSDIFDLRKIPRLANPPLTYSDGTYQTLIGTGLLYKSGNEEFIQQINEYYKQVAMSEGGFRSMGDANKFVRDQEILIPFQYIMNADNSIFSPHVNSLLWMNDPQNHIYQAVQNYLDVSLRQVTVKRRHLNKSISLNESVQQLVLNLMNNK